jgi:hypothetical protein
MMPESSLYQGHKDREIMFNLMHKILQECVNGKCATLSKKGYKSAGSDRTLDMTKNFAYCMSEIKHFKRTGHEIEINYFV